MPYQALLEGVFLDLDQAQLYVETFQKHQSSQAVGKTRRNISKPYPFDPDILNPMIQVCTITRSIYFTESFTMY